MNEITQNWYQELLQDLKKLEFTGIVLTKWNIGRRIVEDELKFGKPKYGGKGMETLAADLGTSKGNLYKCVQFFKKFPKIVTPLQNLSWREIVIKYLPEHRETSKMPLSKEENRQLFWWAAEESRKKLDRQCEEFLANDLGKEKYCRVNLWGWLKGVVNVARLNLLIEINRLYKTGEGEYLSYPKIRQKKKLTPFEVRFNLSCVDLNLQQKMGEVITALKDEIKFFAHCEKIAAIPREELERRIREDALAFYEELEGELPQEITKRLSDSLVDKPSLELFPFQVEAVSERL